MAAVKLSETVCSNLLSNSNSLQLSWTSGVSPDS